MVTRTPTKVPLECYGTEYSPSDKKCGKCRHIDECKKIMGARLHCVPLDELRFHISPEAFGLAAKKLLTADPGILEYERLYVLAYQTVFDRDPPDVGRCTKEIIAAAKEAECSLRVFILANMIGHKEQQTEAKRLGQNAAIKRFSPKLLTGPRAVYRAQTYAHVCRKNFGAFAVQTLDSVLDHHGASGLIDRTQERMLNSEVIAGTFIANHKITHEGDAVLPLYEADELRMDEVWLAIEPNYYELILKPFISGKKSKYSSINNFRHNVCMALNHLKKKKQFAIAAFQTREAILPAAVKRVCANFNYRPADFESKKHLITDPFELWARIGLVLCHIQCELYVSGLPSCFGEG